MEAKLPYIDPEFKKFAMDIDPNLKVRKEDGQTWGKWILRKAFEKVLAKVTGNRTLPRQSGFAKLKNRANRYVQQYRYLPLESDVTASANDDKPDRLLWVLFDERAINRLLRESGIAVWGSIRPATLVWLGIEQQGRRGLYQPEIEPALGDSLRAVARERGLPLHFPLLDLEDRSRLQPSDLWGGFAGPIQNASDRYQADAILVGRLQNLGGEWQAQWSLYQQGQSSSWQSRGRYREEAAAEGLHRAVDELATRFAPKSASQGSSRLRLRVSGLNSLADYVQVRDYLHSLGLIEQLDLLSADAHQVSYLASAQGGREALEKSIMLGGVLEPVVSATVAPAQPAQPVDFEGTSLDYRLR
jgi:hypothetical protein